MPSQKFTGKEGDLERAITNNEMPALRDALERGADVSSVTPQGANLLMVAVDSGNLSACLELLNRGADPNSKTVDGDSAMSLSVANYRQHPEIMLALLKNGGDPNVLRSDEDPVVMRFINDFNCDYIKIFRDCGADINASSRTGRSMLVGTMLSGDWDMTVCLLELGALVRTDEMDLISSLFEDDLPRSDSPIYPSKQEAWGLLKAKGYDFPSVRSR